MVGLSRAIYGHILSNLAHLDNLEVLPQETRDLAGYFPAKERLITE